MVKGALLRCEKCSFGTQKGTFCFLFCNPLVQREL